VIKVENFTDEVKTIRVLDQIPVPSHEDIKIKLEETSPKVSEADDMNRFQWEVRVDAGAKEKITYSYSAEFPRDMAIPGLP